jgi:paraquat-inducible protein B
MSDTDQQPQPPQDKARPPQAHVHRRGFSWIWLVPIVALGVVAWLGWQHLESKGPTITITFERGEGLEAGKTQIKHKSVPVGLVKSVELSKDLKKVIVTADLDKGVEDFLGKDTKFWVVRPRFNAGNISGLDTLVSGSYIIMRPSKPKDGDEVDDFTGLENPPVDVQDVPGTRFTLHTDHLGSVDQGTTIYYRGLEAGNVLGYKLNGDGKSLDLYIFIRDPFSHYITDQTRFWNTSSVGIETSANGFQIKLDSLKALFLGGITFANDDAYPGLPAKPDADFPLYDSQHESDIVPRGPSFLYTIEFPGQVHALSVHAPVELQGRPIGRVTAIDQQIDLQNGTVETPVTVEIEQAALPLVHTDPKHPLAGQAAVTAALDQLVRKGYRAKLASASLLTGQRFVQIVPVQDDPPAKLIGGGPHPRIPATEAGSLDDLTASGNKLIKHLDVVVGHADTLVQNLATLTGSGQNELQDTVKSLNGAVHDMDRVLNNLDSEIRPLGSQLPELLKELKNTARSATSLLDYVDQHPESLLLGRSGDKSSSKDSSGQAQ